MKFLRNVLIIFLGLLLVVGGVGYFLATQYITKPAFADHLSTLVSQQTGGDCTITTLEPSGLGIKTEKVTLTNAKSIKKIKIKGFGTTFDPLALFTRTWKLNTLECNQLDIHIGKDKRTASHPLDGYTIMKAGGLLDSLAPNKYELTKLSIGEWSGIVEQKKNNVEWNKVKADGKFRNETLQLNLQGGTLALPSKLLRHWNVKSADVSATIEDYQVNDGQFYRTNGGEAIVNGRGAIDGESLDAQVEFSAIPISDLVKPSQYVKLSGAVQGFAKAKSHDHQDPNITGTIAVTDGLVTVPEKIQALLKVIGLKDSNQLALKSFSSDLHHHDETTTLSNLLINAEDSMSLTGKIVLMGDTYQGAFRFGLSEQVYKKLPGKLKKQYQQEGNFYWVPVSLAGDKDDFINDLSAKILKSAAGAYLGNSDLLDKLGDSVMELIDGGEEDPVKQGLNLLKGLFK